MKTERQPNTRSTPDVHPGLVVVGLVLRGALWCLRLLLARCPLALLRLGAPRPLLSAAIGLGVLSGVAAAVLVSPAVGLLTSLLAASLVFWGLPAAIIRLGASDELSWRVARLSSSRPSRWFLEKLGRWRAARYTRRVSEYWQEVCLDMKLFQTRGVEKGQGVVYDETPSVVAACPLWGGGVAIDLELATGMDPDDLVRASNKIAVGFHASYVEVVPNYQNRRFPTLKITGSENPLYLSSAEPTPLLDLPLGHSICEPCPVGINSFGEVKTLSVVNGNHSLWGGETGGGKSVAVSSVLWFEATSCDAELWLIDLKMGQEAKPWAPIAARTAYDIQTAHQLLSDADAEMRRRYREAEHRSLTPSPELPQIIINVDELAELPRAALANSDAKQLVEESWALLGSLISLGRAALITIQSATQKPDTGSGIKTSFRDLHNTRIGFKCSTTAQSDTILGDGTSSDMGYDLSTLPPDTQGLGYIREGSNMTLYRSFHVRDEHIADVVRRIQGWRLAHQTRQPSVPDVDPSFSPALVEVGCLLHVGQLWAPIRHEVAACAECTALKTSVSVGQPDSISQN